jgi:hypothetical protein
MQKTAEYQALLYAFSQEGCPICRLAHERVRRFLETWKYELFTDVSVRQQIQRARGFCHAHTWQLANMGASLQLAQSYRDIISDTIEQLQRGSGPLFAQPGATLLQRIFETKRPSQPPQAQPDCLACQQQEKAELRYIDSFLKALPAEDFHAQFAASHGLCLQHFRQSWSMLPAENSRDSSIQALLCKAQLACLQRLDEQLAELIRKHDYRFKDEEHGPEMLSWKRAAGIVSGEE